jgi:hypothetical protein
MCSSTRSDVALGLLKFPVQHLADTDIGGCDENVQRTDFGRAGGNAAASGIGRRLASHRKIVGPLAQHDQPRVRPIFRRTLWLQGTGGVAVQPSVQKEAARRAQAGRWRVVGNGAAIASGALVARADRRDTGTRFRRRSELQDVPRNELPRGISGATRRVAQGADRMPAPGPKHTQAAHAWGGSTRPDPGEAKHPCATTGD